MAALWKASLSNALFVRLRKILLTTYSAALSLIGGKVMPGMRVARFMMQTGAVTPGDGAISDASEIAAML
jgi:hypothetical protein